ncbi:hypothetical protein [Belnapia moabensis]|uniref:hypothetical protein n=1 Tax=Belnapia moabensis TaxID=365533 RepID=UPI0012EE1C1C|nr:hypothetical protein [Belnapia moabensis]
MPAVTHFGPFHDYPGEVPVAAVWQAAEYLTPDLTVKPVQGEWPLIRAQKRGEMISLWANPVWLRPESSSRLLEAGGRSAAGSGARGIFACPTQRFSAPAKPAAAPSSSSR